MKTHNKTQFKAAMKSHYKLCSKWQSKSYPSCNFRFLSSLPSSSLVINPRTEVVFRPREPYIHRKNYLHALQKSPWIGHKPHEKTPLEKDPTVIKSKKQIGDAWYVYELIWKYLKLFNTKFKLKFDKIFL